MYRSTPKPRKLVTLPGEIGFGLSGPDIVSTWRSLKPAEAFPTRNRVLAGASDLCLRLGLSGSRKPERPQASEPGRCSRVPRSSNGPTQSLRMPARDRGREQSSGPPREQTRALPFASCSTNSPRLDKTMPRHSAQCALFTTFLSHLPEDQHFRGTCISSEASAFGNALL
jgi:hypothetical protein